MISIMNVRLYISFIECVQTMLKCVSGKKKKVEVHAYLSDFCMPMLSCYVTFLLLANYSFSAGNLSLLFAQIPSLHFTNSSYISLGLIELFMFLSMSPSCHLFQECVIWQLKQQSFSCVANICVCLLSTINIKVNSHAKGE